MSWRRFAFHMIWFWGVQIPGVAWWQLEYPDNFKKWGLFYLAEVSVAALELTALNWWAAEKAKDEAITVEALVEETTIEKI